MLNIRTYMVVGRFSICLQVIGSLVLQILAAEWRRFNGYSLQLLPGLQSIANFEYRMIDCLNACHGAGSCIGFSFDSITGICTQTSCGRVLLQPKENSVVLVKEPCVVFNNSQGFANNNLPRPHVEFMLTSLCGIGSSGSLTTALNYTLMGQSFSNNASALASTYYPYPFEPTSGSNPSVSYVSTSTAFNFMGNSPIEPFTLSYYSYSPTVILYSSCLAIDFVYGNLNTGSNSINLRMIHGAAQGFSFESSLGDKYFNDGSVCLNKWCHTVLVFTGTQLNIYINGLYFNVLQIGSPSMQTSNSIIGLKIWAPNVYNDPTLMLYCVQVYSTALSSSQAMAAYQTCVYPAVAI